MNNYRVFLPGIVGNTESPGELLLMKELNLKDYGVIAFGENGEYVFFNKFNFTKKYM